MNKADRSPGPNEQLYESLRMMYREHTDQARHHDSLRERSTAVVVTLAAGLASVSIAYIGMAENKPLWALALSLPIIFAGIFGMILSTSHSRNNRQHVQIARAFRFVLQIAFERTFQNEQGNEIAEETEENMSKTMKWLADKLPRKIQGSVLSLNKEEKILLPDFLSDNDIVNTKTVDLCKLLRDKTDVSIRSVAPYDFRTIRDYGVARHNLQRVLSEKSVWTYYVERGWFLTNAAVVIFGFALSILILFSA